MPGMSTNVVDVSHGLSGASIASNRLNTPFDTLFNGCGDAPSSDGAVSSPPAARCAEPERTKTATNAAAPRTDKATASLRGHLFLPLSSNMVSPAFESFRNDEPFRFSCSSVCLTAPFAFRIQWSPSSKGRSWKLKADRLFADALGQDNGHTRLLRSLVRNQLQRAVLAFDAEPSILEM